MNQLTPKSILLSIFLIVYYFDNISCGDAAKPTAVTTTAAPAIAEVTNFGQVWNCWEQRQPPPCNSDKCCTGPCTGCKFFSWDYFALRELLQQWGLYLDPYPKTHCEVEEMLEYLTKCLPPCLKITLECDGQFIYVTEIICVDGDFCKKLSGSFPRAILTFWKLKTLKLTNNKMGGPIPPELFTKKCLCEIDLCNTYFCGQIPPISDSCGLSVKLENTYIEVPECECCEEEKRCLHCWGKTKTCTKSGWFCRDKCSQCVDLCKSNEFKCNGCEKCCQQDQYGTPYCVCEHGTFLTKSGYHEKCEEICKVDTSHKDCKE